MKEHLKRIIAEYWDRKIRYVPREKVPSGLLKGRKPIVLVGPRRSGKSYTMHEMRDSLIRDGEGPKAFLYLNFEDERLSGFSRDDFDSVLEAYHGLCEGQPILLLDEVQNIDGWANYLRRLADGGYMVVATGSNSTMLSREIAERLGGRFPEIDLFPLDFQEFLRFKGMDVRSEDINTNARFEIERLFEEYLSYGGFPEVALLPDPESKLKLIRTYFDLVFYKDVLSRESLRNEDALRFIIKKLRESIGNAISPRAIHSSLLSAEIAIGPNTVEKYLSSLRDAFLILEVMPYAKSVHRQERKKRYLIDNSYIKVLEVKEDRNLLLENLVLTEMFKKGLKPYYHQGKRECDFILGKSAIQVTWELSEGNQERELGGLIEAMDAYGLEEGLVITSSQEKTIDLKGKAVRVMPAWKWCLDLKGMV